MQPAIHRKPMKAIQSLLSDQNDLNKGQSRNDLFEIFLERPTGLGIVADVANRIISSYQTRRGLSIGKTF